MNIIGHGIDLIELEKIRLIVEDPETDFMVRCFTLREQSFIPAGPNRISHIAGRFTAKEAVAKALGTGFDGEISPLEIEIIAKLSGAPEILVCGHAAAASARLGIATWRVSISHSDSAAIASVIALGRALPVE